MKVFARKIAAALLAAACVLALTACGAPKAAQVECWGLDAIVTAVDLEQRTITVKDFDGEEELFGQGTVLTIADERNLLYCNYETGETSTLTLEDFKAGDEVILQMLEEQKELVEHQPEGAKAARTEAVQLGTQRLN